MGMSEGVAKPDPLRAITPEDFGAFMSAKSINPACPKCPHVGWTVHDISDVRGIAGIAMGNDGNVNMRQVFPLLPLSCNNCGYVWLVARVPVENWLKEREANAST